MMDKVQRARAQTTGKGKMAKDALMESALGHWAPRMVSNGVMLTDFQEVCASIERWDDWCAAWCKRAGVHEALGHEALAEGYKLTGAEHLSRAAVYVLKSLDEGELKQLVLRASDELGGVQWDDEAMGLIVGSADGDGRKLLNNVEIVVRAARNAGTQTIDTALLGSARISPGPTRSAGMIVMPRCCLDRMTKSLTRAFGKRSAIAATCTPCSAMSAAPRSTCEPVDKVSSSASADTSTTSFSPPTFSVRSAAIGTVECTSTTCCAGVKPSSVADST